MRRAFGKIAAGLLGIAVGAAGVVACASSTDADAGTSGNNALRQCFLPSQVNGFHAADDETVYVTLGARRVFRLDIVGTCPDVDWSQQIGIRSRGGGSWICGGLDAELIVPSPSGVQRCPVTNVRQLSEQEVAAYRESRRRKK